MADHIFGGVSTDLKLSLVERYLKGYTKALSTQFKELWYIDAFAGSGERTVKIAGHDGDILLPAIEERIERRRGSARIALDVQPRFSRIVLFEAKKRFCVALEKLRMEYPGRRIDIVRGDANQLITDEIGRTRWSDKRAVIFLDPYGMQVNWTTLERIRATEAIDVWYLVSLAGLFRQATHNSLDLSADKRAALTRMLGTAGWESAWYQRLGQTDIWGRTDDRSVRTADVTAMEDFTARRLKSLFPAVLPPMRLHNDRGTPMFSLFFAISNRAPKAIGLATRIANSILKPDLDL